MKNKKEIRVMLTINFMAELVGIITLYLSSTHVIKILKTNILGVLFIILSVIGLLLIFKLIKTRKEKLILFISFIIELLVILFSFFTKTKFLTSYFQVVSDILKYILILNIYKSLNISKKKKGKDKTKKIVLITMIFYILSKLCYILINVINGVTIKPIITTISIIGIVLVYTIYIKSLEKDS